MIAVVSKFEVRNGMEVEVKNAFRSRPQLVENAKGFVRLDVISPLSNPAEIHLITYWETNEDYEFWHKNHLKESHQYLPKGLKIDPKSRELVHYEHVTS